MEKLKEQIQNNKQIILISGLLSFSGIAIGLGISYYFKFKQKKQIEDEYNELRKKVNEDDKNPTQMLAWRASSPGKIIIFGDHTNELQIGAAVDLRTVVTLYQYPRSVKMQHLNSEEDFLTFNLSSDSSEETIKVTWTEQEVKKMHKIAKNLSLSWRSCRKKNRQRFSQNLTQSSLIKGSRVKSSKVCKIFLFLLFSISTKLENPIKINVISQIPSGLSLGSSSSFASSLVSALLMKERIYMCNRKLLSRQNLRCDLCEKLHFCPDHRNFINSWVTQAERFIHTNSSGIDTAISVYGSGIYFSKNPKSKEFIAKPLFKYGRYLNPPLRVLFIVTEQTDNDQYELKERTNHFSTKVDKKNIKNILQTIHKITLDVRDTLHSNNRKIWWDELSEQTYYAQKILMKTGISHPNISKVSQIAKKYGYSAKSNGYGKTAFIFLKDKPEKKEADLQRELELQKYIVFFLDTFVEGVRRERVDVPNFLEDRPEPLLKGPKFTTNHLEGPPKETIIFKEDPEDKEERRREMMRRQEIYNEKKRQIEEAREREKELELEEKEEEE